MDDTAGCKVHWYDRIYDECKYSNGYSAPEAFYGPGKTIANGCELQHKTFSYVDQRSGRTVRLYGIVDRYSPGADADFLVSQIVSDLLPFDRTTDHVLNNDPSDREIYCLLDEVLRKVYKVDLNSSTASTRSYHESESRGSPGSSGSRHENNSTPEMNNLAHGNVVKPTNGVNPSNSASANLPINETVAQKLSVMEFLNFYKDIIERVDEAADADQKKYPDLTGMNQVNPIAPPLNPYNGYLQPAAQYQYPTENPYPYIEVASNDNYMYKSSPVHPSKKRNALVNRKFVTRNTSLPTISESIEKWWSEEGEYLTDSTQQQNFNFPDNTVMPEAVPPTFQPASMTAPMEVARSSDDDEEFLHAIEKIAVDLGYIENNAFKEIGETASVKSDDKSSVIDSSNAAESIASYTAAAIVFIYGDKMFVGSIGDSRVVLMRRKCHYLDVMYLNEPPLAWYPIAAAKNSYFKSRRYILFQEPIIRGGFLINEYSIFLLMFNDGVITNMLNMNEYYRTSNEINRNAVQMVIKILQKYPSRDIAQKFIAHIKHSCNRKYKPVADCNGVKREGMSFLFADLRQLIPKQPDYNDLLKTYQPKPTNTESKVQSYPKMTEFTNPLQQDEEAMKHASSMNKIYDMLQEIFDREENERRAMNAASMMNEETWVFLRTDLNETQR